MVDSASIRWFENVNDADRLSSRLLDKVRIVPSSGDLYLRRVQPVRKIGNRAGIIFMLRIITPFYHDKRDDQHGAGQCEASG